MHSLHRNTLLMVWKSQLFWKKSGMRLKLSSAPLRCLQHGIRHKETIINSNCLVHNSILLARYWFICLKMYPTLAKPVSCSHVLFLILTHISMDYIQTTNIKFSILKQLYVIWNCVTWRYSCLSKPNSTCQNCCVLWRHMLRAIH